MTIVEFFEQVPKDGWEILGNGAIRRHKRQCPISSLENCDAVDFEQVGIHRELSRELINLIVLAADRTDLWEPIERNCRQRMIELFNLPQSLEVIPK